VLLKLNGAVRGRAGEDKSSKKRTAPSTICKMSMSKAKIYSKD